MQALAGSCRQENREHQVIKQHIRRDGLFAHHLYDGLESLHYTDNGESHKQILTDRSECFTACGAIH